MEVFFLVKSWLPPKKCITEHEPVLRAHKSQEKGQRTQGGARGLPSTQVALLDFQGLGESHPRLQDHCPCSAHCPMLRLSGAQKHPWLWGGMWAQGLLCRCWGLGGIPKSGDHHVLAAGIGTHP